MAHVGLLTVGLQIPAADSLKDKRHVLKGLLESVRRRFNVSAAEVEELDSWRRATLAFTSVSNSTAHTNRILDQVVNLLESCPEIVVDGVDLEMI